ncbi:hypothetical protein CPLU01_03456 [Colletotrichum plurivorum]|uniref:non-specific serine/threonine protein kinase n=1 Tax=Colletotrichum plurivorum TaxID=2175906 RepID=A0A8H6KSS9_9PEZI|nr:hypothetical protein CPLU01_03456 [Colletotrichum plurivorum]
MYTQQLYHHAGTSASSPHPAQPVMTIEANNMFPNDYREFDNQTLPNLFPRSDRLPSVVKQAHLPKFLRLEAKFRSKATNKSSGSTVQKLLQTTKLAKRCFSPRGPRHLIDPDGQTSASDSQDEEDGIEQRFSKIQTIERVAAAKIFLETYFEEALSGDQAAREMSVGDLRNRLHEEMIPFDEMYDCETRFIQLKNAYRREQRVAKARSCKPACPEPSRVFAMKVIRKSDMLRSCQEGHLRAERDFMATAWNSNCTNLYLLMDYMPGGDFLGLLIRENILDEPRTRFYIAEMLICVEEVHNLGYIHRDVKPDNFLIGADGHLKISDFGLAFNDQWYHDTTYYQSHRQSLLRHYGIELDGDYEDRQACRDGAQKRHSPQNRASKHEPPPEIVQSSWNLQAHERNSKDIEVLGLRMVDDLLDWRAGATSRSYARSNVGTSQYMAPEVIRGEKYDGRYDYWSIGIILYECIYGYTPFFSDKGRQYTKHNILFDGVEWSTLRFVQPEWVPQITSFSDTQYFDDEETVSDRTESVDPNAVEVLPIKEEIIVGLRRFGERRVMKETVRRYGRKEHRRPRDKLLRDPETKAEVMRIRKQTAFLGYSWLRPPTPLLAETLPEVVYDQAAFGVASIEYMPQYEFDAQRVATMLAPQTW